MSKRASRTAIIGLALLAPGLAMGEEPGPMSTVRLVKPDRQLEAIIGLFRGSKAAHPAAAFAAWKRATADPKQLGKPLEALIVAFNPSMAREWKALDESEVAFWFGPGDGRFQWGAALPHDDGTFASLATTMVLSGGEAEPPFDGLAVDRLGPVGAPLMARDPVALLISGNRDGLKAVRDRKRSSPDPGEFSGVEVRVDPRSLEGSKSLAVRQVAEGIRGIDGRVLNLSAGLVGSTFRVSGGLTFQKERSVRARIKPEWLDWIPVDRAVSAFALATDPKGPDVGAAFQLADQVQRVDPAAANLAPFRLRVELLSRTIGLRTEADLWPHLEGVSGWLAVDGDMLRLHLDDEASARSIFDRIKTLPNSGPIPKARTADRRWIGLVEGRPLWLARVGPTVLACWGEGVLEATLAAKDDPALSAGATLRSDWGDQPPSFAGGFWPGRLRGVFVEGSAMARTMASSPPLTWTGWMADPTSARLKLSWPDLDARVRQFLELIPLDPPPDR